MKKDIHPTCNLVNISCTCGNEFQTKSVATDTIRVTLCNQCHPFFTGAQRHVDTEGRIERFERKYGKAKATK